MNESHPTTGDPLVWPSDKRTGLSAFLRTLLINEPKEFTFKQSSVYRAAKSIGITVETTTVKGKMYIRRLT